MGNPGNPAQSPHMEEEKLAPVTFFLIKQQKEWGMG